MIRLQCQWRRKLARKELRKRRASQREAGRLLQVLHSAVYMTCIGMYCTFYLEAGRLRDLLQGSDVR